jgi:hypothetical protein
MLHGRLMKAGFVAALLSACFGNAQVRPAECDASLPQVNTPLGYRNRGDRCEGVYVKEVSSTPLTIRSFTDGSASYEEGDPTAESSHHSFSPTGG